MMKYKRTYFKISMLFILSLALSGCKQVVNEEIGKFREAPCPFDLPEGLVLGENFKFGYVTVPEFHSNPNGKTIEVAVAIFPSTSDNPSQDPIVFNTGGPGESNMDNFIPPLAVMKNGRLGELVLPYRDAVVIELRGLRYSKPNLLSEELSKARNDMMDKNLNYDEILAVQVKALQKTRDRFNREGINPSAFNNVETAADIDLIMTNLGYDKFNLFGSSAGTLLAQHVIRDYPNRVRSAVLNASVPIGSPLGRDMVPEAINSLKRIFNECEEDPDCSNSFPKLEDRFLSFLDSLNSSPITIPIEIPGKDKKINYVLNGYRFAGIITLSMYFNPQIPFTIDQVISGDYSLINLIVGFQFGMNTFADILGYTVMLSESPIYTHSDIIIDPAYSTFAKGATSLGFGGEYLLSVDTIFNISKLDPKTVVSQQTYDVPLLVLNGLYDPVIPVSYDEILKNRFTNEYIYRFDGVAHSPVDFAEKCAIGMFFEFIEDPTKAPESSCVAEYHFKFQIDDK